jgi:hypothetical protein
MKWGGVGWFFKEDRGWVVIKVIIRRRYWVFLEEQLKRSLYRGGSSKNSNTLRGGAWILFSQQIYLLSPFHKLWLVPKCKNVYYSVSYLRSWCFHVCILINNHQRNAKIKKNNIYKDKEFLTLTQNLYIFNTSFCFMYLPALTATPSTVKIVVSHLRYSQTDATVDTGDHWSVTLLLVYSIHTVNLTLAYYIMVK